MKMSNLSFKSGLLALTLTLGFVAGNANAGIITTGSFTGADAGEGLDFEGSFEYAVNVLGNGGFNIGDASFTNDSVSGVNISAQHSILNWHNANYGNSADDNSLEYVMQSIRWSGAGTDVVRVDMSDLVVGDSYSLQLLFAETCCTRGFDVFAEGQKIVDDFSPYVEQGFVNNQSAGAFVRYDFVAGDSTLNITFGGSAPFGDNNPILNGFTLEHVTSVPEPSTTALLALSLFGLAARRIKK